VAIAFPAAAQTPKPSVGSDQVYWVITFTVDQLDKFKPIVNKIVAATEKEPGTLAYEYTVGDDQKTVDIYERYTNAHAAVVHVTENFGPNFLEGVYGVGQTHALHSVHRRAHGRTEEDAR
jgi:quinol monooxygenase YgiN